MPNFKQKWNISKRIINWFSHNPTVAKAVKTGGTVLAGIGTFDTMISGSITVAGAIAISAAAYLAYLAHKSEKVASDRIANAAQKAERRHVIRNYDMCDLKLNSGK
ncbi:MAG: hypothetical protein FWC83_01940 [Alphaproteobacteria bacterium]|nr:hypothetical protein [Alphaproteobacteria bacterium]